MDNFSPHLSTKVDTRVGDWAKGQQRRVGLRAHQCQLAQQDRGPVPGAPLFHPGRHRPQVHAEQNSMIRRYIIWRNRNAQDKTLRELLKRANVA